MKHFREQEKKLSDDMLGYSKAFVTAGKQGAKELCEMFRKYYKKDPKKNDKKDDADDVIEVEEDEYVRICTCFKRKDVLRFKKLEDVA